MEWLVVVVWRVAVSKEVLYGVSELGKRQWYVSGRDSHPEVSALVVSRKIE